MQSKFFNFVLTLVKCQGNRKIFIPDQGKIPRQKWCSQFWPPSIITWNKLHSQFSFCPLFFLSDVLVIHLHFFLSSRFRGHQIPAFMEGPSPLPQPLTWAASRLGGGGGLALGADACCRILENAMIGRQGRNEEKSLRDKVTAGRELFCWT